RRKNKANGDGGLRYRLAFWPCPCLKFWIHMRSRKRKWLLGVFLVFAIASVIVLVTAVMLARRFEPYIREQAILYLRERFDGEFYINDSSERRDQGASALRHS